MWFLAVLTFALPWVVTIGTANPYLEAKELLLVAGGWGLILWTAFCQPVLPSQGIRNPFLGWIVLYAVGVAIVHFQWVYLWRTLQQEQIIYNVYTWLPTVSFLMAFLLLRTLALQWFQHPPHLRQLTQWMCLSAALVACYAIGQALHLDQWFVNDVAIGNTWKRGIHAGFGNPSYLAIYLAAVSPLCLLFKSKRYLAYFVLILIGLYLTQVRYAWVLAGIGVGSYLVSRWWVSWTRLQRFVVLAVLLAVGIAVGRLAWGWTQGDERWMIWQQSWQLLISTDTARVDSWTGRGLGAYELLVRKTPFGWAHNEWLQGLIEFGVIGTGLLLGAVGWATKRAWYQATHSLIDASWFGVWMALLVASVIHFPFHLPPIIWVGLCAWAVIERDQGGVGYG